MDVTTRTSPAADHSGLGREPPPTVHTRLEFEVASGSHAPAIARQVLAGLGAGLDPSRLHEVRLLVTELVTNSVRHSGNGGETTVTVSLELTESTLHVAVSNPGAAFEAPETPPDAEVAEGGRGLMLVERLADRWGIDDVHEARVWFELSRADAAPA